MSSPGSWAGRTTGSAHRAPPPGEGALRGHVSEHGDPPAQPLGLLEGEAPDPVLKSFSESDHPMNACFRRHGKRAFLRLGAGEGGSGECEFVALDDLSSQW